MYYAEKAWQISFSVRRLGTCINKTVDHGIAGGYVHYESKLKTHVLNHLFVGNVDPTAV
jgi:hypothetical protein